MATALDRTIPEHIPSHLVRTLPLFARTTVYENPYETLIPQMQVELPPVCYATNIFPGDQPAWLLKHAEDVQAMLRDADNYTKRGIGKFAQSIGEDWLVIPTEADPPVHTEYRKALNNHFSPQKMFSLRDRIRQRARDLIAAFADRGHCNFIRVFSEPFPINIVLDLLGLPQERMREFLQWEHDILHNNNWNARSEAVRNVRDYLRKEIQSRREQPRDDYITTVLSFESFGRPWTADEVLGHCFNLYIGGLDTVTALLGNIFNFLASSPGHQRSLRDNPSKVVLAVEEFLRAFAPVTVFRIASAQHVIRGETIMPGDYIAVSTPLVGRDPAFYENPDEIRFDRKAAHMSLGSGIHKCLGMHLARLELQIALEEFMAALPEFRIRHGFSVPYHAGNVLHVEGLELQW